MAMNAEIGLYLQFDVRNGIHQERWSHALDQVKLENSPQIFSFPVVVLLRMNFACPYCGKKNDRVDNQLAQEYDDCCPGKPSDKACIPDNAPRNFRNDIAGCEKFRSV